MRPDESRLGEICWFLGLRDCMSHWVCCLLLQQCLDVFVSFSCAVNFFCLWCLCFCRPSLGLSFGLWEGLGVMCQFFLGILRQRARRVPSHAAVHLIQFPGEHIPVSGMAGMGCNCFTMFSTSFWAATSALASFGHGPTMATHLSSLCSLNIAKHLIAPWASVGYFLPNLPK